MIFENILQKLLGSGQQLEKNTNWGHLYNKIKQLLPQKDENELIKVACISGLLARIAYADLKISTTEAETIKTILKEWAQLNDEEIAATTDLALTETKNLSGIENHKYCRPLNDQLNKEQKYQLLVALFALAAGDGSVEHVESEEIRLITKGLRLEHRHYIAAKATVLDRLKALKDLE